MVKLPGDHVLGEVSLRLAGLRLTAGGAATTRNLVSALDMAAESGQRWVVIGPNGAGKSSLLAAIAGVFPIGAGEVRIDGRALSAWRPEALAGRRAWMPQFWHDPFAATVAETAVLARDRQGSGWRFRRGSDRDAALDALLTRLDLQKLADADVQTLSGGERQRVSIATALLQGAPLLLLDEPASHLDPAHQRLLLDVLHEHAARGGLVMASLHDLNLAWDLASHAVVLDGKGGVAVGPRDAVLTGSRMSAVFGIAIEAIELAGARRFVAAPEQRHAGV